MSCLVVKTRRKSAKCRQVNVAPINSGGWLLLQPAKAFGANDTCPWSAKPRKKNENDMSLSQRSCTVRVTPCVLYGIISASCCTKKCIQATSGDQGLALHPPRPASNPNASELATSSESAIGKKQFNGNSGTWSVPTSIAKYSRTLSERKFRKRINWLP